MPKHPLSAPAAEAVEIVVVGCTPVVEVRNPLQGVRMGYVSLEEVCNLDEVAFHFLLHWMEDRVVVG